MSKKDTALISVNIDDIEKQNITQNTKIDEQKPLLDNRYYGNINYNKTILYLLTLLILKLITLIPSYYDFINDNYKYDIYISNEYKNFINIYYISIITITIFMSVIGLILFIITFKHNFLTYNEKKYIFLYMTLLCIIDIFKFILILCLVSSGTKLNTIINNITYTNITNTYYNNIIPSYINDIIYDISYSMLMYGLFFYICTMKIYIQF